MKLVHNCEYVVYLTFKLFIVILFRLPHLKYFTLKVEKEHSCKLETTTFEIKGIKLEKTC